MLAPQRTASIAVALLAAGALLGCGSATIRRPPPRPVHLRFVWGHPPNGQRPRALLLMIHGGGWKGLDTASYKSQAAIAVVYQRLGYETLTFDYRGGRLSVFDAERFYRSARRRVGPRFPICALGPSAGGHIALMLALENPDLRCVIDFAGPTDLVSLGRQPGGAVAHQIAVAAFGAGRLAAFSPALHAGALRAKVMLVFAQTDPLIPVAQGTEMAQRLPGAQLIVLPPGPVGFVHSPGGPGTRTGVDVAAYDKSIVAEEAFLNAAAGSPASG